MAALDKSKVGAIRVLQAHHLLNHCSTPHLQIPAAFGDLDVLRLLMPPSMLQVDLVPVLCSAVSGSGAGQNNKQHVAALLVYWETKHRRPQHLELVQWLAELGQPFTPSHQKSINTIAAHIDSLVIMQLGLCRPPLRIPLPMILESWAWQSQRGTCTCSGGWSQRRPHPPQVVHPECGQHRMLLLIHAHGWTVPAEL